MYRLFFGAALLVSISSFAQSIWETPLCKQIFSSEGESAYTDHMLVISEQTITLETEITELQAAQLVTLAFYSEEYQGTATEAIKDFDEEMVTYKVLLDVSTGMRYQHIAGYRGDTDVSGIYTENFSMPIAFTGDGDCYQDL